MRLLHTYIIPVHVSSLFFPAFISLAMTFPGCKNLKLDLEKRELVFELEVPVFAGHIDIAKIGEELRALAELEPDFKNPMCPCGCGAVIIFNTCFSNQPELMLGLTEPEVQELLAGNKIGCIKKIRERTGLMLREAKDMADRAAETLREQGMISRG